MGGDLRMIKYILCALLGYFAGCFSPSYLLSRRRGFDIRTFGSGNAGATNMMLAAGFAGQNQMLTTLSAMLRRNNKTDAAVQAARTVNRQKVPVYQADLTMIQNTFMAALREVKKEIGNDFTAAQSLTKGITQQMFTELTKGADVHTPTITPEMISAAVTQSAAGMDGVQKEALDKFGQALTEFLQSTLDHAQEKQNADPEQ